MHTGVLYCPAHNDSLILIGVNTEKWDAETATLIMAYCFATTYGTLKLHDNLNLATDPQGLGKYRAIYQKLPTSFTKTRQDALKDIKKLALKFLETIYPPTAFDENNLQECLEYNLSSARRRREENLAALNNKMQRLLDDLNNCAREKEELLSKPIFVDRTNQLKDVANVLNTYENITLVINQPSKLILGLKADIRISNEEALQNRLDNNALHIGETTKKLLEDIFIKKTIALCVEDVFCIDSNGAPRSITRNNWNHVDEHALWFTHTHNYNCFGNYTTSIGEALAEYNIAGLIEILSEVITTINVYDDTVVEHFIDQLEQDTDIPCLRLPDGTWITVEQYFEQHEDTAPDHNDEPFVF